MKICHHGFSILLMLFVLLAGCDKLNMQIDSKTMGEIDPDSEVFIQFKQNIVSSPNLKTVLPISATINGESSDIKVSFIQENKLVLLFPKALSSNTLYNILQPIMI